MSKSLYLIPKMTRVFVCDMDSKPEIDKWIIDEGIEYEGGMMDVSLEVLTKLKKQTPSQSLKEHITHMINIAKAKGDSFVTLEICEE